MPCQKLGHGNNKFGMTMRQYRTDLRFCDFHQRGSGSSLRAMNTNPQESCVSHFCREAVATCVFSNASGNIRIPWLIPFAAAVYGCVQCQLNTIKSHPYRNTALLSNSRIIAEHPPACWAARSGWQFTEKQYKSHPLSVYMPGG